MPTLDRPVVLITGSSRGLGRCMAEAFARDGFAVAIHYNKAKDQALETKSIVEKWGSPALLVQADVSSSSDVNNMFTFISESWGRLDVLVNNAGMVRNRTIARMTDEEWKETIAGNLDGVFYCTRAALPLLRKNRNGVVLSLSSYVAERGTRGAANYAAAKAGVIAFAKSLAQEESANGVRSNAIIPGFHVTDINRDYWEKFEKKIREQHLLDEMPDRKELAEFVLHIAKLRSVTGQVFAFESRIL